MNSLLKTLTELKTELNNIKPAKTKIAREKNWDKACTIRRSMAELIESNQDYFNNLIVKHAKRLNVMAPIGGPLYLGKDSTVELYSCNGTYFTLTLDSKWVGIVHLTDDSCGIDNVEVLKNLENHAKQERV